MRASSRPTRRSRAHERLTGELPGLVAEPSTCSPTVRCGDARAQPVDVLASGAGLPVVARFASTTCRVGPPVGAQPVARRWS